MKVLIEADEQYKSLLMEIAEAIKAKISFQEKDFRADLPPHVKEGITEGQKQAKEGKVHSFEEVKKALLTGK